MNLLSPTKAINSARETTTENYKDRMKAYDEMFQAYLKGSYLAKKWTEEKEGRTHSLTLDSLPSYNLWLKLAPNDEIAQAFLFMENFLPTARLSSREGVAPHWTSFDSRLWIFFDPDSSEHCRYKTIKKTITREEEERTLVCL